MEKESASQGPTTTATSFRERLQAVKIPQAKIVLSAVEDTLRDQKTDTSPTAYFAVILALLSQSISSSAGIVNKDLATSVLYLLDIVTPFVPRPLLRSKFSQVLNLLVPVLTHPEVEAPLLRSAIGCLESLLLAQDAAAWALSPTQLGPRSAVAGILGLGLDHRPKVRKRAQDALTKVLKSPPPTPSLDHPVAEMCAETCLTNLRGAAKAVSKEKKKSGQSRSHEPALIHALQLVKTVAAASGGWPSKKIEPLCELLLSIARSTHEYLTMATFDIFEAIFEGMADEVSSTKLPRLMQVISELKPSQNDSHLLPPWIAILARGYEVSAEVDPQETFQCLPEVFQLLSEFLASSSHNIRESASEGLVSLLVNCIPAGVIYNPSIYDGKILEKLTRVAEELLTIKYQAAWMEIFNVLGAMLDTYKWRADPLLSHITRTVGELRGNESFNGKKEADELLGKAVSAMGPEAFLRILPLNLSNPKGGEPGRAWLLPILRTHVSNTNLAHFKTEFVPLSAIMFQKVMENTGEKTMEIKILETVVQQIWAIFPGYCDLPLDLTEALDQSFAEQLANILYKQVGLRHDICKGLQALVDSNKAVLAVEHENDDLLVQRRVTKVDAQKNIDHLATFAGNMLAVLFNVYSETLPQYRGFILRCINAYLSISPDTELSSTFAKVVALLESALTEEGPQTQAEKQKQKKPLNKMPPMSHTFVDLIITMAIYLPRDSFGTLFNVASSVIMRDSDPQLQKKAYKLLPRLAESEVGTAALRERNPELQQLMLISSAKVSAPARRDRLAAIAEIVKSLPSSDLHFIPSILSEVVISAKEVNEKARTAAFDLLVSMGEKMQQGGMVVNARVPHMPDDAPDVPASLEEYFTMVSAGLAGSTPHMISASITALTRILYHFRESLPQTLITDLVSTLDLFLTSNNREVVRSVLGFVKVCVISLSTEIMLPRLQTLIPNLMRWSHEHKAHFKAKVKHIMERMIRRFGVDKVEKLCPEEDRKLIVNIKKTRERRKKKKDAAPEDEADDEMEGTKKGKKGRFESEFDQAIYGSEDDSDETSDNEGNDWSKDSSGKRSSARDGKRKGPQTFIIEDSDEPLDLLDPKSLSHISSTKPVSSSRRQPGKTKAKTNADGKLILGDDENDASDDAMILDFNAEGNKDTGAGSKEGGGINAYIDAISGKDAVQRGQRGRLKFSNKRSKDVSSKDDDNGDEADKMDVDKTDDKAIAKPSRGGVKRPESKPGMTRMGAKSGKTAGVKAAQSQRRGLGMAKTRGGRVAKAGWTGKGRKSGRNG